MPSRTQAPSSQAPSSRTTSSQDAGTRGYAARGTAPGAAPGDSSPRTLWSRGHHPGRLVVRATTVGLVLVTLVDLLFDNRPGALFDMAFVLLCLTAALWVHPRDFFTVGVLPPLLLCFVVVSLAAVDRAAVARPDDSLLQAVVSGLAHHSLALVTGYGLALLLLALRQVARRNGGALRRLPHSPP